MNVLITGGMGFIGSNLARRLIKEGQNVTLFDNFSNQVYCANYPSQAGGN
jgi:nucleoside-diphosphate-sugar epimerase